MNPLKRIRRIQGRLRTLAISEYLTKHESLAVRRSGFLDLEIRWLCDYAMTHNSDTDVIQSTSDPGDNSKHYPYEFNVYEVGSHHIVALSSYDAHGVMVCECGEEKKNAIVRLVEDDERIGICTDSNGEICKVDGSDGHMYLTARQWIDRELPKNGCDSFVLCREG